MYTLSSALHPSPPLCFAFLSSLSCLRAAALGQVVDVDSQESVTLHRSTAVQEHRLLGKLHSLEGTINQATGLVRGGRGRVFRVAKGQNLDLIPIEVSTRIVRCEPRARDVLVFFYYGMCVRSYRAGVRAPGHRT